MLVRRVLVHFVTQIVHKITMRTLVQVQVVELEMLEETFDVGLESPLAVGARQGGFLHVQGVQVVTQIRLF
jgi:flagella basal body P-ring formation protein FlgA